MLSDNFEEMFQRFSMYGINELNFSTFSFGTTSSDWLMNRATKTRKAGTKRNLAMPSIHVILLRQYPRPLPLCKMKLI